MKGKEMTGGGFTDREINQLKNAAISGDNSRRDIVLLFNMLYLGLDAKEAAGVCYCTAFGDAIENRQKMAFLHIPIEYRRMIQDLTREAGNIRLKDRLTDCGEEEAENAVKQILARAGISINEYTEKAKRTAARLHYQNAWTHEDYIKRYFSDIKNVIPEESTEAEAI